MNHWRTSTWNHRHYPAELYVRMQMSDSVGSDIKRSFPSPAHNFKVCVMSNWTHVKIVQVIVHLVNSQRASGRHVSCLLRVLSRRVKQTICELWATCEKGQLLTRSSTDCPNIARSLCEIKETPTHRISNTMLHSWYEVYWQTVFYSNILFALQRLRGPCVMKFSDSHNLVREPSLDKSEVVCSFAALFICIWKIFRSWCKKLVYYGLT